MYGLKALAFASFVRSVVVRPMRVHTAVSVSDWKKQAKLCRYDTVSYGYSTVDPAVLELMKLLPSVDGEVLFKGTGLSFAASERKSLFTRLSDEVTEKLLEKLAEAGFEPEEEFLLLDEEAGEDFKQAAESRDSWVYELMPHGPVPMSVRGVEAVKFSLLDAECNPLILEKRRLLVFQTAEWLEKLRKFDYSAVGWIDWKRVVRAADRRAEFKRQFTALDVLAGIKKMTALRLSLEADWRRVEDSGTLNGLLGVLDEVDWVNPAILVENLDFFLEII